MNISKRFLVILGLLGAYASCASAQSPPAAASKEHQGSTFKLACWSEWTEDALYIGRLKKRGESKMTKLSIYNMNLSKAYPYSHGQPINFYKKTDNPEQPYQLVLSVAIPPSIKDPLVLLALQKKGASYSVYELDEAAFPYGSLQFVNFTTRALGVSVGEDDFVIKPKAAHTVIPEFKGQTKALPCRTLVKHQGETHEVYSAMLMVRAYKRELTFFYLTKDKVGRSVMRTRSLVDFESKK
jgi:hypothetical protein